VVGRAPRHIKQHFDIGYLSYRDYHTVDYSEGELDYKPWNKAHSVNTAS